MNANAQENQNSRHLPHSPYPHIPELDAQLKADLGKVIRIATKLAAFNSGSVKG